MVLNNIYMIPHGDELIDIPDEDSRKLNNALKELSWLLYHSIQCYLC